MNCQEFMHHLNDALDETLPNDVRQSFDKHATVCASCAEEKQLMMDILNDVANLPTNLLPERDLWTAIQEQIEDTPQTIVSFPKKRKRFTQVAFAAAAILVVMSIASISSISPTVLDTVNTRQATSEHDQIKQDYADAKNSLLAALEVQKEYLAPETLATIEENLSIIQDAVMDIDRALAANPNNEQLEGMLYAAYHSEVSLLQNAVQLNKN